MARIPQHSKADYQHIRENQRIKEIKKDQAKIDTALEMDNLENLRELHRYLDSKYGAGVKDWGMSMYGFCEGFGFDCRGLSQTSLRDNLSAMRAKLEGLSFGWNEATSQQTSFPADVSVTVNNAINVNLTFDQARNQVEDMSSLTDEQIKDILDKIDKIENVANSAEKTRTKWERIKPLLSWLTSQSLDIAKIILPIILPMLLK